MCFECGWVILAMLKIRGSEGEHSPYSTAKRKRKFFFCLEGEIPSPISSLLVSQLGFLALFREDQEEISWHCQHQAEKTASTSPHNCLLSSVPSVHQIQMALSSSLLFRKGLGTRKRNSGEN